jgi:hypothetical protein
VSESGAVAGINKDSPSAGESVDDVEFIVGRRLVGDHLLYKVHWRGSSSSGEDDEWFSRDDLIVDFPRVVKAYEASISSPLNRGAGQLHARTIAP